MTNRGLATAVFRAWGLFWAISGCVQFVSFALSLVSKFRPYSQEMQTQYEILQGCGVALTFFGAVFLFLKSGWLSTIVFPEEAPIGWTVRGRELGAILFCVV